MPICIQEAFSFTCWHHLHHFLRAFFKRWKMILSLYISYAQGNEKILSKASEVVYWFACQHLLVCLGLASSGRTMRSGKCAQLYISAVYPETGQRMLKVAGSFQKKGWWVIKDVELFILVSSIMFTLGRSTVRHFFKMSFFNSSEGWRFKIFFMPKALNPLCKKDSMLEELFLLRISQWFIKGHLFPSKSHLWAV